ncbi:MAG: flavodoxin family protein [Oscillospiraceae bacterium]|nr:flavodoxin family protein [Oscillospiraceae bacterium]
MKVLIHDLSEEQFQRMKIGNDTTAINADGAYASCLGCFKCWLKNSGYCDMKDSLRHISSVLGRCDELVLISKLTYGGYSTPIKRILDRSISISLPLFTYRGGAMHHIKRYRHEQNLRVCFYGAGSDSEKIIAKEFTQSNGVNWGMKETRLDFFSDVFSLTEYPI